MIKELNAVILARVSSKSQEDEGYSLDSQLKLLNGYCESKGLNIVKVFKIAETASKEQSRKTFQEMFTYLHKGDAFHIVVEKTDRFTRNFHDAVAIDDWLNKDAQRRLHAVKENLLLHREAKSDVKFMWNIHVSVAKKYADNLREEAMKGWAEKLAQGWLPAVPPPGYVTTPVNGKRVHLPDPHFAPLIKKIFNLYLEPQHSIKTITEEMQRMGFKTRKGHPYTKSYVQRVLDNPFYIGINRFDGQDYPGAQERIIAKQVFERVQEKMHGKRPMRYRKHDPVFKNLIGCELCGGLITWQLQKGRYYGACQRSEEACKKRKFLREDQVEIMVVNMLKKLVSPSQEVVSWVADVMRSRQQENIDNIEKQKAAIRAQIARLTRMEDGLYDDKLAGDISIEKYKEKNEAIQAEKRALEGQLSKLDTTGSQRLEQRLVLLELSQKAAELYPKKTSEQKRLIITKLFSELACDSDSVSVKLTKFAEAIAEKVQESYQIIGGTK
jgi:DNA invertase Pin-like site-specific DNA recombinase